MKRLLVFFCALFFFSGCAVHTFQKSETFGGYTVARFGYVIPEYTVDLDNKAPEDRGKAKIRYLRRKAAVENYYLKMGQIEDYLTRYITHFPKIIWSVFANTLKMPFHIVSEYRYEHNEAYRKRIDQQDALAEAEENERIKKLKDQLYEFLKIDLEKEKKQQPPLNAPS